MASSELFGWSKAFWDTLDQWGILLGLVASGISIIALFMGLIALFSWKRIRHYFTKNRFPEVSETLDASTRWQGLLFTVSNQETPEWVIKTRKPACISLLATQQSRKAAEAIQQVAEGLGVKVFDPVYLENSGDSAEAKREAKHLLQRMREAGVDEIAVDITGGTKPMSVGTFMAAEESSRTTVYVHTDSDAQLKHPNRQTATLKTLSEPH